MNSIVEPYLCISSSLESFARSSEIFPVKAGKQDASKTGTIIQIIDGINKYKINFTVVTLSPIQSIVVVTSPIGDQAPPAFAEIIINPANHILVLRTMTTF